MDVVWSEEVDSILSAGYSLNSLGVRNWALDRDAALSALERLSGAGIGVLGGDVYISKGHGVEPSYDSWYCNKDAGELSACFASRSISKAKGYILAYPQNGVLFALVPDIS